MQIEDLIQVRSVLDPLLSLDLFLSYLFHNLFHCSSINLSQTIMVSIFVGYSPEFLTYCFSLGK